MTAQEQQGLNLFGLPQLIPVWAAFCATPCLKPPNTPFAPFNVDDNGVPQNVLKFSARWGRWRLRRPHLADSLYRLRHAQYRPPAQHGGHRPGRDCAQPAALPEPPGLQQPLAALLRGALEVEEGGQTKLPSDVAAYVPDTPTPVFPIPGTPLPVNDKSVTKGAFKVPDLRNGMLTGPYMHDGTYSTLRQVVQFYARGGNFPNTNFNEIACGIVPLAIEPSDPLECDTRLQPRPTSKLWWLF